MVTRQPGSPEGPPVPGLMAGPGHLGHQAEGRPSRAWQYFLTEAQIRFIFTFLGCPHPNEGCFLFNQWPLKINIETPHLGGWARPRCASEASSLVRWENDPLEPPAPERPGAVKSTHIHIPPRLRKRGMKYSDLRGEEGQSQTERGPASPENSPHPGAGSPTRQPPIPESLVCSSCEGPSKTPDTMVLATAKARDHTGQGVLGWAGQLGPPAEREQAGEEKVPAPPVTSCWFLGPNAELSLGGRWWGQGGPFVCCSSRSLR